MWVFFCARRVCVICLSLNQLIHNITVYKEVTYRTRPPRQHGSASVDHIASVSNFWLSDSFQIPFEDVDRCRCHCSIIKTIPNVNNTFWEQVVTQFSWRSKCIYLLWDWEHISYLLSITVCHMWSPARLPPNSGECAPL